MHFHWYHNPANPIVNQHFCNRSGFLVRYCVTFGVFADIIADYVLILVLGHRERTCYVHCNSFERRTYVVLLHPPSHPSPCTSPRRFLGNGLSKILSLKPEFHWSNTERHVAWYLLPSVACCRRATMWHKISINVAVCSFYGKIVCSMRQCRMLHVASVEFRLNFSVLLIP